MAPIRVGLLGLSSKIASAMEGGGWAASAHLPPITELDGFQLVAIANSSRASAQKAKEIHKLDASVKTYGSPEDLANDPDVDLVVVSVGVKTHYTLAKPALLAKKRVVIEWPLTETVHDSQELTTLAKQHGVQGHVISQGLSDPVLAKIKEIVHGGAIGEVTASFVTVNYVNPLGQPDAWIASWDQWLNINGGSNSFVTGLGQFLHCFTNLLGPVDKVNALLNTHYKTIKLYSGPDELVEPAHPRSSPDHLVVNGSLASGALFSISHRAVPAAADNRGITWIISGTKGELLIESPMGFWPFDQADATLRLRRGNAAEDEIIPVVDESKIAAEVPAQVRNVARMYEAIARNDTEKLATFEAVLETQKLLDRIMESSKRN